MKLADNKTDMDKWEHDKAELKAMKENYDQKLADMATELGKLQAMEKRFGSQQSKIERTQQVKKLLREQIKEVADKLADQASEQDKLSQSSNFVRERLAQLE